MQEFCGSRVRRDVYKRQQQDDLAQEQYMWESEAKGKGKGKGRRKDDKDMVRLFLNVGKKQKLKPGDILGAIAGESGQMCIRDRSGASMANP